MDVGGWLQGLGVNGGGILGHRGGVILVHSLFAACPRSPWEGPARGAAGSTPKVCSICSQSGHNARTCPQKGATSAAEAKPGKRGKGKKSEA
jgi:hypothetical protein